MTDNVEPLKLPLHPIIRTRLITLMGENETLQYEIEKLREVLKHTVMLFEEILEAIDADPVETMLVLRKNGVEVERIIASQCFNKARTLLGEKE